MAMSCEADAKRHEHRQRRDAPHRGRAGLVGQPERPQHQPHLGDEDPRAPPPEPGRAVAVHERRPEELEVPGCLGEREEADGLDVDAAVGEPGRQEDPDEPSGKPEEKDCSATAPTRGDRAAARRLSKVEARAMSGQSYHRRRPASPADGRRAEAEVLDRRGRLRRQWAEAEGRSAGSERAVAVATMAGGDP